MLFWAIAIALTLGVVALLLAAANSADAEKDAMSAAEADMAVYRDQLAEIDRDLARGVLTAQEADAVRVEVSRRLLEADKRAGGEALKRSRGAGTGLVALVGAGVLAGAFGLYVWLGAPGYGDLPIQARLEAAEAAMAERPGQDAAETEAAPFLPKPIEPAPDVADLIDRLRAAVAENPTDLQGQRLLAQNELRFGNIVAARAAQEQVVALQGDQAPVGDRIGLLDIMVLAADGYVSPESERLARGILAEAPDAEVPLYYIGLMYAQGGRADRAFPIWRQLLETSAPDAPWVPVIRAQIEDLAREAGVRFELPEQRGPSQADIAAAQDMSPEDRAAMIEGMVAQLSDRLATQGGPVEDWARLITALGVLGRVAQAEAIANEAEQVFQSDARALAQIEAARERLGR